jgi:acetyl esterase/lipase
VPQTLTYGDHPSQHAELTRPLGQPRGVVAVIHGGFWKAAYGLDLGRPLAADLTSRGWTTLNVEYRRVGDGEGVGVGDGGGDPATFDDVAAALRLVGDLPEASTLVTLGHSAGGHLATWAAARTRYARWADGPAVTHVVSQAGVLDLGAAHRDGLGDGAVEAFVGPPGPAYDLVDPTRQLPLDVPVTCVHGRDDDVVPPSQSADYVARSTAAGARAELIEVDGDHFVVIDTGSSAWTRTCEVLAAL